MYKYSQYVIHNDKLTTSYSQYVQGGRHEEAEGKGGTSEAEADIRGNGA
jgi:hypothetical protein